MKNSDDFITEEWVIENWKSLPDHLQGQTLQKTLQNIHFVMFFVNSKKTGLLPENAICNRIDNTNYPEGPDYMVSIKDEKDNTIEVATWKFENLELEDLNQENKLNLMIIDIKQHLSDSNFLIYWFRHKGQPLSHYRNRLKELSKYCTEEELNCTLFGPMFYPELGMLSAWTIINSKK